MVRRKSLCSREGFETPITKATNNVPIPAPAPPTAMVAAPAPISLAACTIIMNNNHVSLDIHERLFLYALFISKKRPSFDTLLPSFLRAQHKMQYAR